MADLATTLPEEVEIGAVRRLEWSVDVTRMDSGSEVRNGRWSAPLRVFDISYPHAREGDAVFEAVRALYEEAEGQLYSFPFTDPTDGETIDVRFDSPLELDMPGADLMHIVSLTVREVR